MTPNNRLSKRLDQLRCPLCLKPPTNSYDQERDLWIVGCECARAVKLCGAGHPTFDLATECWNSTVRDIENSMKGRVA